jgi:hypothetical protein
VETKPAPAWTPYVDVIQAIIEKDIKNEKADKDEKVSSDSADSIKSSLIDGSKLKREQFSTPKIWRSPMIPYIMNRTTTDNVLEEGKSKRGDRKQKVLNESGPQDKPTSKTLQE